jgi:hypothetical protein
MCVARHCEARRPSSDSIRLSREVCLGLEFHSKCLTSRLAFVLQQDDLLDVVKMRVGQAFQSVGVVDGGAAVGELDASPAGGTVRNLVCGAGLAITL